MWAFPGETTEVDDVFEQWLAALEDHLPGCLVRKQRSTWMVFRPRKHHRRQRSEVIKPLQGWEASPRRVRSAAQTRERRWGLPENKDT
jgi:hypothetical protein